MPTVVIKGGKSARSDIAFRQFSAGKKIAQKRFIRAVRRDSRHVIQEQLEAMGPVGPVEDDSEWGLDYLRELKHREFWGRDDLDHPKDDSSFDFKGRFLFRLATCFSPPASSSVHSFDLQGGNSLLGYD
jgi:hypothetical protein